MGAVIAAEISVRFWDGLQEPVFFARINTRGANGGQGGGTTNVTGAMSQGLFRIPIMFNNMCAPSKTLRTALNVAYI